MRSCTRAWLRLEQPTVMDRGCSLIPSLYMPILPHVLALRAFTGFTSWSSLWHPRVFNCHGLIHGLWIWEQQQRGQGVLPVLLRGLTPPSLHILHPAPASRFLRVSAQGIRHLPAPDLGNFDIP